MQKTYYLCGVGVKLCMLCLFMDCVPGETLHKVDRRELPCFTCSGKCHISIDQSSPVARILSQTHPEPSCDSTSRRIMLNGSICTVEEQALFNSTASTSIVCLTRGDSIGLTLVAESGFISLVAVVWVFILIFVGICLASFVFPAHCVVATSTRMD
jgi:hypothetical protein